MFSYKPCLLGTSLTEITSGPSDVDYLVLANVSEVDIAVTIQDSDGNVFFPGTGEPVKAGTAWTVPIPEGGLRFNGIQAKASVPGQVYFWVRCKTA